MAGTWWADHPGFHKCPKLPTLQGGESQSTQLHTFPEKNFKDKTRHQGSYPQKQVIQYQGEKSRMLEISGKNSKLNQVKANQVNPNEAIQISFSLQWFYKETH